MQSPRAGAILVRMLLLARVILLLLVMSSTLQAQSAKPATTPVKTIDMTQDVLLDLPDDWSRTPDLFFNKAFLKRSGSDLVTAFHPQGSRPTDLPYILHETFGQSRDPTEAEQTQTAEIVRSYYTTAVTPPSTADRAGSWKRAKVTPVVHDFSNNSFTFRATIQYDVGGEYTVDVHGVFGKELCIVLSAWTDAAARDAHGPAIDRIMNSLRRGALKPKLTFQQQLMRMARVSGVLLILLVIGLQVFVLIRERRQRQADALELERLV